MNEIRDKIYSIRQDKNLSNDKGYTHIHKLLNIYYFIHNIYYLMSLLH